MNPWTLPLFSPSPPSPLHCSPPRSLVKTLHPRPTFSYFSMYSTFVLLSPSLELLPTPTSSIVPLYSPAFWGYPDYILTSRDLELGATNKREHVVLSFWVCVSWLNRLFHPFACKLHDFIFLYSWIEFLCVCTPHFHCPFISWWKFRLFSLLGYCK